MALKYLAYIVFVFISLISCQLRASSVKGAYKSFNPGSTWLDDQGTHINAHGGDILYYGGKYYWFGEHKGENSNSALVGVMCYSSRDLYNWTNEGIALSVIEDDENSPIVKGSVIERPKVIYNTRTNQFVMYFHLELRGKGYAAAYVGIAVSDKVNGPYIFLKSGRVNAGIWPLNMTGEQQNSAVKTDDFTDWWTPEWRKAVNNGLFVRRDFEGGQMSRDMTLFVDDDGKAYQIYSSEENLTLQIAELTDDYLGYTGRYIRVEPGGHNEAPAVFKKDGRYYMITSGCTGWDPNTARLLVADEIMGEWTLHPNPCIGEDADLTFHSQSTYILPIEGKKDAFLFMADRWTPQNPIDGRYIWLPIQFKDGLPFLEWMDEWDLTIFDQLNTDSIQLAEDIPGWKLVWNDDFNIDGAPDPTIWNNERGFVRNEELQWYKPENAICQEGVLTIYGKKEQTVNPDYVAESKDWRKNRQYASYTASSIKTNGNKEFQYGRFEVKAKIPTAKGSWPAIWTLGTTIEWPSCGEIDLMEYYLINGVPHILANTAWGTDQKHKAKWNSVTIPFTDFTDKDPDWADKFHVWRMD